MKTLKQCALVAMAVAVSAVPAVAGTKYAANIVYSAPVDPPGNPTLSAKSSVKLDDKGTITVALAGVTDAGGALVTTSTVYNDTKNTPTPTVDGSEYIAFIKLYLPTVEANFMIPSVEVPVPVDLKAGKGKTKLSAAALIGLIGPGFGRTIEVQGTQVWGPLGAANAATCTATLSSGVPVVFPGDTTTCRSGTKIGISGLFIPIPPPRSRLHGRRPGGGVPDQRGRRRVVQGRARDSPILPRFALSLEISCPPWSGR